MHFFSEAATVHRADQPDRCAVLIAWRGLAKLCLCDASAAPVVAVFKIKWLSFSLFAAPDDLGDVLLRDAVYNAAGLAANDLYDGIDFHAWLQAGLAQELHVTTPTYVLPRPTSAPGLSLCQRGFR
jgi:hypothetical protein